MLYAAYGSSRLGFCHTGTITFAYIHIVTRWSGSGGIEAYLSGQLASFSTLMLLVGSSDFVKIVLKVTYNVSSGTWSLYSLTRLIPDAHDK